MNIILAAWDDNRLIGKGNDLPWHIKEDLQLFKQRTLNHAIIMGRNTWDSLRIKPLPKRENIVVSKTLNCKEMPDGAISHPDLISAIEIAHLAIEDKSDIFIIGGAKIYQSALEHNLVDKMIITHVYGSHEGDVHFPDFDANKWNIEVTNTCELFNILEYTKV